MNSHLYVIFILLQYSWILDAFYRYDLFFQHRSIEKLSNKQFHVNASLVSRTKVNNMYILRTVIINKTALVIQTVHQIIPFDASLNSNQIDFLFAEYSNELNTSIERARCFPISSSISTHSFSSSFYSIGISN
jgi:hypothetical protein